MVFHKTERLVILHVIVFQTKTFDSKLAVSRTAYNNLSGKLLLHVRKINQDCNLNNFKKQSLTEIYNKDISTCSN